MIKGNGNWAIELASADFGKGLAELGAKTAIKMKLNNIVECDEMNSVPPNLLEEGSFKATVQATSGEEVIPVEDVQQIRSSQDGKPHIRVTLQQDKLAEQVGDNPVDINMKWTENKNGAHIKSATEEIKFKKAKPDATPTPVKKKAKKKHRPITDAKA